MTNDVRSPLVYRIAFASLQGMGVDLARKLLDVVGSEQRFFEMSEKDLRALTRGRSKIYRDDYRRDCLLRAASEEAFIREHGISATYYTDEAYPHRLIEAPDAPAMYYSLGQCDLESAHVISVVGTRHATQYGIRFCDTLIGELAARLPDLVVVSGLAYGIDIAAHRAAIKHGVPTVAVLPRGLNCIYPAAHRPDAVAIAKRVVTEQAVHIDIGHRFHVKAIVAMGLGGRFVVLLDHIDTLKGHHAVLVINRGDAGAGFIFSDIEVIRFLDFHLLIVADRLGHKIILVHAVGDDLTHGILQRERVARFEHITRKQALQ